MEYGIRNLRVCHVKGDPRSRSEMQKLIDVTQFKGAFVVCGEGAGRTGLTRSLSRERHHAFFGEAASITRKIRFQASLCAVPGHAWPSRTGAWCTRADLPGPPTCLPADSLWGGDGGQLSGDGGLRLLSQAEMLSLDAAVLLVQLNIRLALEVGGGGGWVEVGGWRSVGGL